MPPDLNLCECVSMCVSVGGGGVHIRGNIKLYFSFNCKRANYVRKFETFNVCVYLFQNIVQLLIYSVGFTIYAYIKSNTINIKIN